MVKPGDRVQVRGTLDYNNRFGILEEETAEDSFWDYVVALEPCEGKFGKVSKIGVMSSQITLAEEQSATPLSAAKRTEFIELMAEKLYNSQTGSDGKFATSIYRDTWIELVAKAFDEVWPGATA